MSPSDATNALIAPLNEQDRESCAGIDRYLVDHKHPQRDRVEGFIAQRFLDVHGARISSFMPNLLVLFDEEGNPAAALGVRDAGYEPLFLEYYLDLPVEVVLAKNADLCLPPSRDCIAEIGNLASVDRRASRQLFAVLTAYLVRENFEWAVFTGCSALTRMFDSLGIETVALGRALQANLPVDQQTWGGYYEDSPRVVAGRVSRGLDAFAGGMPS